MPKQVGTPWPTTKRFDLAAELAVPLENRRASFVTVPTTEPTPEIRPEPVQSSDVVPALSIKTGAMLQLARAPAQR